MIYCYAYTGHKIGLDRARRATTIVKSLKKAGLDATLLANDFRAGVAMKEHGLHDYVTVETIWDVDFIAKEKDAVIVDTFEEDGGKCALYADKFAFFARFTSKDDKPYANELLFQENCEAQAQCLSSVIVDETYFEPSEKSDRTLFFFSDADYDKVLLSQETFFKAHSMTLLWGHYFFVKYEEALSKLFDGIIEAEEYEEAIKRSARVVTASAQCALEAKAAGADVIYIAYEAHPVYTQETLRRFGVKIIDGFDADALDAALQAQVDNVNQPLSPFTPASLIDKLK